MSFCCCPPSSPDRASPDPGSPSAQSHQQSPGLVTLDHVLRAPPGKQLALDAAPAPRAALPSESVSPAKSPPKPSLKSPPESPQAPPGSSMMIWDVLAAMRWSDGDPTNLKPMNVKQEVEAWLKKVNSEPVPIFPYSTSNYQRELECGCIEEPTARNFVAMAAQGIIEAAEKQDLMHLQIGPVPATSLPEVIGHLPLCMLRISGTACATLPFLDKLTRLEHLTLTHHPRLTSLPQALGRLEQLQYLTISNCEQLQSLPPLGKLRNLQSLVVEQCPQLEKLPAGLGNLTKLSSLNLYGCAGLKELPAELRNLTNLRGLDLRGCDGLTKLPKSLRMLPQDCEVLVPAGFENAWTQLRASQSEPAGSFW